MYVFTIMPLKVLMYPIDTDKKFLLVLTMGEIFSLEVLGGYSQKQAAEN